MSLFDMAISPEKAVNYFGQLLGPARIRKDGWVLPDISDKVLKVLQQDGDFNYFEGVGYKAVPAIATAIRRVLQIYIDEGQLEEFRKYSNVTDPYNFPISLVDKVEVVCFRTTLLAGELILYVNGAMREYEDQPIDKETIILPRYGNANLEVFEYMQYLLADHIPDDWSPINRDGITYYALETIQQYDAHIQLHNTGSCVIFGAFAYIRGNHVPWFEGPIGIAYAPIRKKSNEFPRIPINQVHLFLRIAISNKSYWRVGDNRKWIDFVDSRFPGYKIEYRPIQSQHDSKIELTPLMADSLDREMMFRLEKFDPDLVLDLYDILFHHWYSNKCPTPNYISLEQFTQYRRLTKSTGSFKKHWRAICDLSCIYLTTPSYSGKIVNLRFPVMNKFGQTVEGDFRPEQYCKASAIFEYELPLCKELLSRKDDVHLALYNWKLVEYDPLRNKEAKRLLRYARELWFEFPADYVGPNKRKQYLEWSHHLREACIEDDQKYLHYPKRVNKVLTDALLDIYKDESDQPYDYIKRLFHEDDQNVRETYATKETILKKRLYLPPPDSGFRAALLGELQRRRHRELKDIEVTKDIPSNI
jgi:hypothetical protein